MLVGRVQRAAIRYAGDDDMVAASALEIKGLVGVVARHGRLVVGMRALFSHPSIQPLLQAPVSEPTWGSLGGQEQGRFSQPSRLLRAPVRSVSGGWGPSVSD